MKTISLRALSRDAPTISEAVLVIHSGKVVGTYTPIGDGNGVFDIGKNPTPEKVEEFRAIWKEASMDDVAKKAIEPEQVKVRERPGKPPELSKGLGELPGERKTITREDSFGTSRPAPKPGKK